MTTKKQYSNEEIAEALGFQYENYVGADAGDWFWRATDKRAYTSGQLPDFQNDLNACFKYYVPWIKSNFYKEPVIEIKYQQDRVILAIYIPSSEFYGISDTPESAFTEAFMQMKQEKANEI